DRARAGGLIGHVANEPKMRFARTPVETSRRGFRGGAVDVEDCDAGAFGREAAGGCEAYPTRGSRAGNDRRFAAKQHAFLPSVDFHVFDVPRLGICARLSEIDYVAVAVPTNAQLSWAGEFGSLVPCCSPTSRSPRYAPSRPPRARVRFAMRRTNCT